MEVLYLLAGVIIDEATYSLAVVGCAVKWVWGWLAERLAQLCSWFKVSCGPNRSTDPL
jgi:hypothetical protein